MTSQPAAISLFLCGDVMLARGIDRILPHPGDPRLFEPVVRSAEEYVKLAEQANGPVPRPVGFDYVWGDALAELDRRRPDARIINLETAVTRSPAPEPKGINYKMTPENVAAITAAGIDCCVLANNHVLDWGRSGLSDTLATVAAAGMGCAGAGYTLREAENPAAIDLAERDNRVLVLAYGAPSAGVPAEWRPSPDGPGVAVLDDMSPRAVQTIRRHIEARRRTGDVVVASLHWGPNWGYRIPADQQAFARALIDDAGVDVVYGHSSHHIKAIEVYHGRPVLYGCGDFLNDYEGISGHEQYRPDLALMYFVAVDPENGRLLSLSMVPMQIRNLRLRRACDEDAAWLAALLDREGAPFGTRIRMNPDLSLSLEWPESASP